MTSLYIARRSLPRARACQAALEGAHGIRVLGVVDSIYRAQAALPGLDADALLIDLQFEDAASDRSLDWRAQAANPLQLSPGEVRLVQRVAAGLRSADLAARTGLSLEAVAGASPTCTASSAGTCAAARYRCWRLSSPPAVN